MKTGSSHLPDGYIGHFGFMRGRIMLGLGSLVHRYVIQGLIVAQAVRRASGICVQGSESRPA